MAHYGINAEITAKKAAKRSSGVEKAIVQWIAAVIEEPIPEDVPYEDALRDGSALCKLINKLQPGSVNKINGGSEKFKLMENIEKFIAGCQKYGVPHDKLFRTIDLFEKKNIPEVTGGIIALAREVQKKPDYTGPHLDKWVFADN